MVQASAKTKKSKLSKTPNKTGFQLGFADCRFFEETAPEKWTCNVCSSQVGPMSFDEAIEHEMMRLHMQSVESYCLWCPDFDEAWGPSNPFGISVPATYGAPKAARWPSSFDTSKFTIKFWIRQMEAAKEGVELRWESFFEKLVEKKITIWDEISMSDLYSNWPVKSMGADGDDLRDESSSASSDAEAEQTIGPCDNWADEPWVQPSKEDVPGNAIHPEVLDVVTQQGPLSEERTMRLRMFNKMSTEEKVQKIQALVHQLRPLLS